MSNKEIVTDLLQRIPDSASLNEIAREIEFVAAVRQGLAEIDSGKPGGSRARTAFMDYQVVLSYSARADLRDIVRYISLDARDRALRFAAFLISKTKLLRQFPELGRVVPEFRDPLIREIIVRSYRVIYRLNHASQRVEIARFWHASRGVPVLPEHNL